MEQEEKKVEEKVAKKAKKKVSKKVAEKKVEVSKVSEPKLSHVLPNGVKVFKA